MSNSDALVDVLEALAGSDVLGDEREHAILGDRWRRLAPALRGSPSMTLDRLAERAGLRARTVIRSPIEVVDDQARLGRIAALRPAVERGSTVGGRTRAVVVLERTRGGVQVRVDGVLQVLDADGLARALGVPPTFDLEWTYLEPDKPLESLRADAKNGATLTPVQRLWRLVTLEKGDIGVVASYALAIGVLSLAVPVTVQALVNTVAFGTLVQPMVVLTVLVLLGLGLAGTLRALQSYVLERMQERLFVHAANDTAYRVARARIDAFGSQHGPELVNRFFDVLTVQKAAAALLLEGLSVVMQASIGLLLLAFYHPVLLAFDVILLLFVSLAIFVPGSHGIETSVKESKAKYAVAAWLEEIARQGAILKSARDVAFALDRTDELAQGYLVSRRKHFKVLLRQIVASHAVQAIASAALLGVGGALVIGGQLTLGQLVAAELVVASVLAGLTKMGKHIEAFYDLAAAVDKLGALVDLELERPSGEPLRRTDSPFALTLSGVKVAPPKARPRKATFDVTVPAGGTLAVVGASGTGKTTLLSALHGDAPLASGYALVDGVDLRSISLDDLRDHASLVGTPVLFEGTVLDNVRLGHKAVPVATVQGVLGALGVLESVLHLPDGLETRLSTGGAPLSSGQAALVGLARAIVSAPRLLLVDGTLDLLGPRERVRALDALLAPDRGWTLILATRDEALAARCGQALQLDGETESEAAE